MTHLCYTLEEAAEKLKLTETVLVRLSQYFKVPKAAYEESGYLSFKGDLAFTETDIDFFRQAKERLLLGESLEFIKNRIREHEPLPASMKMPPPAGNFAEHLSQGQNSGSQKGVTPASQDFLASIKPVGEPLREIQDSQPYEKAVEISFERYKSVHRTGLGRVFENMLKEVGVTRSDDKNSDASPDFRPLKPKTAQSAGRLPLERLLPFQRDEAEPALAPLAKPTGKRGQSKEDSSWEQLLKQATHQPRTLNSHLKGAAALLRERATGQTDRSGQFLR